MWTSLDCFHAYGVPYNPILLGKALVPNKYMLQPSPLPPGFISHLISLEIRLDASPTLGILTDLVSLYSVNCTQLAIEHYESLENEVFQQYKSRLQTVLKRPDIVSMLDSTGKIAAIVREKPDLLALKTVENQGSLPSNESILPVSDTRVIDTLVKVDQSTTTMHQIRVDLHTQNQSLAARLQDRKRSRLSLMRKPLESDAGGGSSFEYELEQVIERFVKIKRVREETVRQDYERQMEEYADQVSCSTVQMVLQEMRRALDRELDGIRLETEYRKRAEIQKLRTRYQL